MLNHGIKLGIDDVGPAMTYDNDRFINYFLTSML